MSNVNTRYVESGNPWQALERLSYGEYFRLDDGGSTVWRLISSVDHHTMRVLNLDDLGVESLRRDITVQPVEINSIEIKVEIL